MHAAPITIRAAHIIKHPNGMHSHTLRARCWLTLSSLSSTVCHCRNLINLINRAFSRVRPRGAIVSIHECAPAVRVAAHSHFCHHIVVYYQLNGAPAALAFNCSSIHCIYVVHVMFKCMFCAIARCGGIICAARETPQFEWVFGYTARPINYI